MAGHSADKTHGRRASHTAGLPMPVNEARASVVNVVNAEIPHLICSEKGFGKNIGKSMRAHFGLTSVCLCCHHAVIAAD